MGYVVQCEMHGDAERGKSPTMQSAGTFDEAKQQAKAWIKKFGGRAEIYDTSGPEPNKPVMTDDQLRAEMCAKGDLP